MNRPRYYLVLLLTIPAYPLGAICRVFGSALSRDDARKAMKIWMERNPDDFFRIKRYERAR